MNHLLPSKGKIEGAQDSVPAAVLPVQLPLAGLVSE